MSDELLRLADRCEAATGANYALEVDIFKAMHPEYTDYVEGRGGLIHPQDGSDMRVLSNVRPGAYTASLDAAMTLVPEGDDYSVHREGKMGVACVYKGGTTVSLSGDAGAATPPLALCVAALRARASRLRMEVE